MITVAGSLAYDYIMNFSGSIAGNFLQKKIDRISLSFIADKMQKGYGGTAGNIAYTISLLGLKTQILGTAGTDFAEYKEFLDQAGVDTSKISIRKKDFTATGFVITDMENNQIWSFYAGAMLHDVELHIPKKTDFMIIAPTIETAMINFVKECRQQNIPFLVDPGFQLPRLNKEQALELIKGAKVFLCNDYELELFQTKTGLNIDQILQQIETLIVTKGKKGAYIKRNKEKTINISVAKADAVIDPTGAGDCFKAGFVAGLISGKPLSVCAKIGSVAAAYTVEKSGTTSHYFTRDQFCKRYQDNYQEKLLF